MPLHHWREAREVTRILEHVIILGPQIWGTEAEKPIAELLAGSTNATAVHATLLVADAMAVKQRARF